MRRFPGLGALLIVAGWVFFVWYANVADLTPYGRLPRAIDVLPFLIVPPLLVGLGAYFGRLSRLLLIPVIPFMLYGYWFYWTDLDSLIFEALGRSSS
ncbi:hypothetical protein NOG11_07080 [Parvularcula sp. BGMRC 0090]|uniref:Uncharacterized protein n=1 Tax=Parvularcula maris TaxID=2965077 RepID=A0A9X2L8Q6_9PROT|nr:hypothetical protein [Parvularcula maris]